MRHEILTAMEGRALQFDNDATHWKWEEDLRSGELRLVNLREEYVFARIGGPASFLRRLLTV